MRLLILAALTLSSLNAQSAIAFEDSPYSLNVAASASLGAYLQSAIGLRSTDGLVYTSNTPLLLEVSGDGVLTGLLPGEASVTVSGPESLASATWNLNVVPARIVLTPPSVELQVGESITLTAEAFDALNRAIPGLTFTWSAALPQLAKVDGNRLTALAPGQTFLSAQLNGLLRGGNSFSTASLRINPKPLYTTKALISAASATLASPISYSRIVTSNNRSAVIAGFDNGGQAALLLDGASQKVLISSGQSFGENGSVVIKLNFISINRQGDVAVQAELSDFWCSTSIILFPRQGPTVEIPTGCNGGLSPKGLGNDGSLIFYRDTDPVAIVRRSPTGEFTDLLRRNSTVPGLGAIRDFQYPVAGPDGTMLVQVNPASGSFFYALFDGTNWLRALTPGDGISGATVNGIDSIVSNAAGAWYFRANGNGFSAIATMDVNGKPRFVLKLQEPVGSDVRLGWAHRLLDADGSNFLLMAVLGVNDKYDNWLCWVKPTGVIQPVYPSLWESVRAGTISSAGPIVQSVVDDAIRLQRISTSTDILLGPSSRFSVPAAAQWRNLRLSNRDAWVHGAEEGYFRASDGRPVFLPGQKFSTRQPYIAGPLNASHPNGWTLFSALTQNSVGVYLNGNGRTVQLADTAANTTDSLGRPLQWFDWDGSNSRMAVNSRGDAAYPSAVANVGIYVIQKQGEPLPRVVFSSATALPSGAGFSSYISKVDLDDAGEFRFYTSQTAGGNGIYQTNGSTVRTLLSTREPFEGAPVANIYNFCSRNGNALVSFDQPSRGGQLFALSSGGPFASTDFGLPERGGFALNGLPGNFCDASPSGDIFFSGQTADGRTGMFHYSPVTRRLRAVLFAGQKLSDGATLIQPYQISAGPNGTFFFAAHVYSQQNNYLAVYEAVPLP